MNKLFKISALVVLQLTLTVLRCTAQNEKDSTFHSSFNQTIKAVETNRVNLHDPFDILKAQGTSVSFAKKGSDPNEVNLINIRGKGTGFMPKVLYIIDGIYGADPSMLLPYEIESIEVIRDGSQLTAYGTQGSAGVVIIKTREYRGEKKISVNFASFLSLNTPAKKYDLLTADEYRATALKYDMDIDDGGANTDWQDEMTRNSVSQIYRLGVSGKLSNTSYDASAFFDKNPGIVLGTSRRNNGVNLKARHSALGNRLDLYGQVSFNSIIADILYDEYNSGFVLYDEHNSRGAKNTFIQMPGIFYQMLTRNPTDPVFAEDGVTYHQSNRAFQYYNPLQIIDATINERLTNNLRINGGGSFVLAKGLKTGINFGYSKINSEYNLRYSPLAFNQLKPAYNYRELENHNRLNAEVNLDYSKVIDGHSLAIGALAGYRELKTVFDSYPSSEFEPDVHYYDDLNLYNYTLNAGYNYKKRYYLNATGIIEQSQLTASNNESRQIDRSKFYPALSAGWQINNEAPIKNIEIISNLLLRAGYGIRGNGNADLLMFKAYYPGIEDLKTEKIKELSAALDFGFFRNKVSGSIGWYQRNIDNAVGFIYLPTPPNVYSSTYGNKDKIQSNGIELTFSVKPVEREKFTWLSQANYFTSHSKRELSFGEYGKSYGGFFEYNASITPTQIYQNSYPNMVFYLPVSAGYSEDGRPLYFTETGAKTRDVSRAKREVMSQTDPKYYIGWINSFKVAESLDLSVSMSYVGGFSIYNATRMWLSNPFYTPTLNISQEGKDNLEAGYESVPYLSNVYLEDASYLRIDDITLSYTIKCKKISSADFRIFVSAGNLFTFTDFTGYDPAGDSDGVDYFDVYPLAKTYTLGVIAKF